MLFESTYVGIKNEIYDNDNLDTVKNYHYKRVIGTSILCYRDLPSLIKCYVNGNKALDYGCGTGFSTNLLGELKFDTIGVDISERMLSEARIHNEHLEFKHVAKDFLPFDDNNFDLVLSTFVLFDIPNRHLLLKYLKEVSRVLKPDGIFIACTGSEYFHVNNWLTVDHEISENSTVKPGDIYKSYSKEVGTDFYDVFYTHENYLAAFEEAHLVCDKLYQALGKESDDINWTTEWILPPYSTYVCKPLKP
jgi:ubiquinone/menaquinone biosynthesis C-methylase UbiE